MRTVGLRRWSPAADRAGSGGRGGRGSRVAAAGLLLAVPTYLLAPLAVERDAVYGAVLWGAVASIAVGVRVHRPPHGAVWRWLGGGLAALAVAETTFIAGHDHLTPPPDDAVLSGLYVAALLALTAGMVCLASSCRPPGADAGRGGLLEATAFAVAVAVLVWTFGVAPLTAQQRLPVAVRLLAVVYTTGAIVLFAVLLRLFCGRRRPGAAYRLLVAAAVLGVTSGLGSEVLTLVQEQGDPGVDTGWDVAANLGLLAAFGLVAAAALDPSMRRLTEPPSEPPSGRGSPAVAEPLARSRLLLLAVATLTTPAGLLGRLASGASSGSWGIAIGSAVITVLVVTRLAGLLRQVQRQSALLAELADTDPLTGLPNRRAWTRRLTSDLARAERESTPITVALLDLDHFKAFNDAYGHPAGDAALRAVAAGWGGRLRAGDMLARLGGEEFGVLLPGAAGAAACAALDDLRRATPSGLTVSVGAAGHLLGDTGESLLARADAALYAAKRAGRDRVHGSPEVRTTSPAEPA